MISQRKRNPNCKLYPECLTIAATWGIDLLCRGCHLEHNTDGQLTVENFEFDMALQCAKLLHEIFFSSKERKTDGIKTITDGS